MTENCTGCFYNRPAEFAPPNHVAYTAPACKFWPIGTQAFGSTSVSDWKEIQDPDTEWCGQWWDKNLPNPGYGRSRPLYVKGGFNLGAGVSSQVIPDASSDADSLITFMALNAEAALFLAAHGLYYTVAAGVSFTVFSGDGTNFAGTERLKYGIF